MNEQIESGEFAMAFFVLLIVVVIIYYGGL